MPSFFGISPSIRLVIEQEVIFTYRPSDPKAPSEDPILRGRIYLTMPAAKRMKFVKAKLEGFMSYAEERETTLSKELIIPLDGEILLSGSTRSNSLSLFQTANQNTFEVITEEPGYLHQPRRVPLEASNPR